jgi:hypothetical protein
MGTNQPKHASSKSADCVDTVQSPDGVLNVIIRPGQPKPQGIETLRRGVRRPPKRVH